jgi:hypothetical protein
VTAASIPPAPTWADRKPGYYLLDARGTAGAIAANRLLAAGLQPAWLASQMDARGFHYAPGSLVVTARRATRNAPAVLQRIASELGLRSDAVAGRPPKGLLPVVRARIALYKPWTAESDEGWTRWVLEQFEFPFKTVTDSDIRAGGLHAQYDVLVLPSEASGRIVAGQSPDVVPPQYAGGLGDAGTAAIKAFVDDGGTLVSLDQSNDFAIRTFDLPVRDVAHDPVSHPFYCPGSLLQLDVDPSTPLAYGMDAHAAGFFAFSSAYQVLTPSRVTTAARYGSAGDLLVSGMLDNPRVIAGQAAALRVQEGAGSVVLLGFPVQHRGQSYATFRLLFNALLTAR